MPETVQDWLTALDDAFPGRDAQSWDSVGLQVGDPADTVDAVLVCLDVTAQTLSEAAERGANLIVAHHPLLFRPLARLTPETAAGRLVLDAARRGVAVVAAHTNLDAATEGTTAPIMAALGVSDAAPLVPLDSPAYKVVVFTPPGATAGVLDAAFGAGGGRIGEYDECSFRLAGTGTFRPSAAANPTAGQREQRNAASEERIEVLAAGERLRAVVDAIVAAHPYEEVAYDVYPLHATGGPGPTKGLGRVADLPAPRPLREVARAIRDGLPAPHLRVAGDPDRVVSRVAACGGAGDALIDAAMAAGADVYVTGDLRHHPTLDALTQGLGVIDAGHYATEAPAMAHLAERLEGAARRRGLSARLLASAVPTEPWVADWDKETTQR